MTARLFAYGTLRRGLAPAGLAELVAALDWEGEASVPGRLYDLGAYPGAVLDPSATTRVHGELARVDGAPQLWRRLDAYEGELFRRVSCRVERTGVGPVDAWVYVYAGDPGAGRLLPDGRYPTPAGRGTLDPSVRRIG